MKMKVVYEANSLLGDPMTVEGQLNESEHKLEKYKSELMKYQTYLEQANAIQQMQHSPQTNRSHSNSQSSRYEVLLLIKSIWIILNKNNKNIYHLLFIQFSHFTLEGIPMAVLMMAKTKQTTAKVWVDQHLRIVWHNTNEIIIIVVPTMNQSMGMNTKIVHSNFLYLLKLYLLEFRR